MFYFNVQQNLTLTDILARTNSCPQFCSPGDSVVKKLPANAEGDSKRHRFDPWVGKTPEEGVATHSSILAWRIPWTEEPGGLQSMWLQRVRHD